MKSIALLPDLVKHASQINFDVGMPETLVGMTRDDVQCTLELLHMLRELSWGEEEQP
jgi:hypothetical protein